MVTNKKLDNIAEEALQMLIESGLVEEKIDKNGEKVYFITSLGEQFVKVQNSGKKPD